MTTISQGRELEIDKSITEIQALQQPNQNEEEDNKKEITKGRAVGLNFTANLELRFGFSKRRHRFLVK